MSQSERILVAGLGSAHGDDQAGWLVAENLAFQCRDYQDVSVRKASIPLDLLDWLEGIKILHVCDACETTHGQQKLHRFTWGAGQLVNSIESTDSDMYATLPSLRRRGSHDFGLPDVLRLAAETQQLPELVIIWTIEGTAFEPGNVMNDETRTSATQVVKAIMNDLRIRPCMKNP